MKRKRGRPSTAEPAPKKLCTNCLCELYPGCHHSKADCLSKREKLKNIRSNVLSDDLTREQIASQVLRESQVAEGSNSVKLSTLGAPLTVQIGERQPSSTPQLSANDAIAMQANAGLVTANSSGY